MSAYRDRATVVTTAVLQTIRQALLAWLDGDQAPNMAATRGEIQALLRAEFDDIARTALDEIRESE